ncbi:hypothetical protein HFN89_00060 [Rhizobium laguerreae]|nr:hypothetical protein [Rhizobium laguerreae]
MSEIKSFSFTKQIVESTKLSCRAVSKELSVYTAWTTTEVVGSGVVGTAKILKQGVVDSANLKKLQNGNFDVVHFSPIKSDKDRHFNTAIITPEGREYIRLNGNPLSYANVWEHLDKQKMLLFPKGDTPWVEVVDEANVENLHFMATFDHSIVDITGRLVPTARTLEFANDGYDLEKACKVLAANPEVEIIPDRSGRIIRFIPGYNATEDRTLEMKVKWMPGPETWEKMLKGMDSLRNRNGSKVLRLADYDLLGEFDVLGLEAAGCRVERRDEDL